MTQAWRWWQRRGTGVIGVAVLAQFGGCLPNNAVGNVFSEQVLNTLGIGVQGVTSLFFGLPDLILNTLTLQFIQTIVGS